jgi:uncharacterized membrane protein YgdD (TMEM256/DUF423 family)
MRGSGLWIALAGLSGAMAVAAGAAATHLALPGGAGWAETASRYQLIHALALTGIGLMSRVGLGWRWPLLLAGMAFVIGTILFCGGLYARAFAGWHLVGPVVPVGGSAFILGWLALALSAVRR